MTCIWGTNYAIVKHAFAEIDPQAFNAMRMILASSVFVTVMGWMQGRRRRPRAPRSQSQESIATIFHTEARITPREWLGLTALGIVGHCVYQYCFVSGLSRTSVANSALLVAVTPVLIALITAALGQDRIGGRHWAGVALSLSGIYIVVGQGASLGGSSLPGDLMMLVAVLCWTLYTLGARSLVRRHSPVGVTGISMVIGSSLYVAVVLPHLRSVDWRSVSGTTWAALIYSALFSICVAYTIWYAAVREIGSARTAVYSNLVPVVAMAVAVMVLGEPLGARKALGAAAVLIGVALTRMGPEKVTAPAE
jgi:drug/metabolite transporter (DMT)-like permease